MFIRRRVHFAGRDMRFVGYDHSIVEIQKDVALLLGGGLDPETGGTQADSESGASPQKIRSMRSRGACSVSSVFGAG